VYFQLQNYLNTGVAWLSSVRVVNG